MEMGQVPVPQSEMTDINPNPKPSALRTSSTKRPMFGASGKSLSFDEESICTVIPNDPMLFSRDNENASKCAQCSWWEPDCDRNLSQYFVNTSIHGLKYLGEPRRHILERIFWIFSFVVSCLVTSYLIRAVWLKYSESPVIITFQPVEIFSEQIPFPAITICNQNKILKSKAMEYIAAAKDPQSDSEAYRNVYYLDHVCSTSNKPFSTIFNYTSTQGTVDPYILELATSKINPSEEKVEDVSKFLQKASQPCSDMLKLCLWEGDIVNCSKLFHPIETNFGKCCTFNMVPQTLLHRYIDDERDNPEDVEEWGKWDVAKDGLISSGDVKHKKKYPRRQNRAGKRTGLSLLLNPDLEDYYCTAADSTGFRLVTHLSTEVPHVTDFGLAIKPNSEHFVSVRPEITLADDSVKNIDIKKRLCYMEGEYELKYYKYYTSGNCVDECVANLTYKECSCVRYYMPRDSIREICEPSKYECAEAVLKKAYASGVKRICQRCLPSCNEIRFEATSSSNPFRRRVDLWVDEFNVSTSWSKSNISIIHVYIGQDSTYARVRSQLYGLADLIANFGGLLGLGIGFSGLSLVEAIYFFTIRVWFKKKRKRWTKKKQERREALDRDREKAFAYLGVGSSRRSSIDSNRSNSFKARQVVMTNPKAEKELESGYSSSATPSPALTNNDNNGYTNSRI